jgi:hypothetical protein
MNKQQVKATGQVIDQHRPPGPGRRPRERPGRPRRPQPRTRCHARGVRGLPPIVPGGARSARPCLTDVRGRSDRPARQRHNCRAGPPSTATIPTRPTRTCLRPWTHTQLPGPCRSRCSSPCRTWRCGVEAGAVAGLVPEAVTAPERAVQPDRPTDMGSPCCGRTRAGQRRTRAGSCRPHPDSRLTPRDADRGRHVLS